MEKLMKATIWAVAIALGMCMGHYLGASLQMKTRQTLALEKISMTLQEMKEKKDESTK